MQARKQQKNLVFVEWQDSYGCSSNWQEINTDGEPQMMLCQSVGWIIHKSKHCIVVVPHLSQNQELAKQQGCGDMTIPTASIVRMVHLKLPAPNGTSVSSVCDASFGQGRSQPRS